MLPPLVLRIIADSKGVTSGIAKTEAQVSGLKGAVTKFSSVAGLSYAAAGVAAAAFAVKSVNAALDAEEAQRKLANSVENSARVSKSAIPAFNEQAESIRKLTAADDEAITGAQAFLVQMGLTRAQVLALTPKIVDLSVKMGIDMTTAAKAVGKSVNGTTTGLQRMGIVVDKTRAATDAYGATLDALGVVQGFAQKQADAEPWKKMGSAIEELEEAVGKALLPTIRTLADTMNQAIPVIEFFTEKLANVGAGAETGALGLTHLAAKFDLLPAPVKAALDAYGAYKARADEVAEQTNKALGKSFEDLAPKFAEAGTDLARGFIPYLFSAGDAARGLQGKVRRFANLTGEALKDWRRKVRQDLESVSLKLDGLAGDWKKTANQTITAARRMRDNARTIAQDLDALAQTKAPQVFKRWLVDEGPGWVHGYVNANRDGKNQIEGYWRETGRFVGNQKAAFDKVTGALGEIKAAVNDLPRRKTINIDLLVTLNGRPVNIPVDSGGTFQLPAGFIPHEQAGGPVQGMRPYIVGEAGPELFIPSTGGTVVPNHELASGGGVTIHVHGDVNDADRFAQKVEAAVNRAASRH